METTILIKPRTDSSVRIKPVWIKLFIFKILYGFQSEMYSVNNGQYIYNFMEQMYSNDSIYLNHSDSVINKTQFNGRCLSDNKSSVETKTQDATATLNQYDEMISSGLSIFIMIILGPMTDKLGRKFLLLWVVLMSLIGLGIRTFVVFSQSPVYYLLITSTFLGLAGTHYTFDLALTGMIADTTSRNKQRSFVIVMVNAGDNIGFCIAQITTGYLIHFFGYLPQYPICVAVLLTLCIGIFLLKENYNIPEDKTGVSNCCQSQMWTICSDKTIGNRKQVLSWLFAFLILKFSTTAYIPLRNLYQLGSPFCWTAERIGWYGAGISVAQFVFGPMIVAVLQRCMADEYVLQISAAFNILCLVIYGLATQTWMLYTVIGVGVIRYSAESMINAIMSRKVSPEKQGALFSVVAVLDSSVRLGGVPVFSSIYKQTRPIYKGLTFFVMALFTLLASIFSLILTVIFGVDQTQNERTDMSVQEEA